MRVRCGACRTQFEVAGAGRFACPVCGSVNVVKDGVAAEAPPQGYAPPPEPPAPPPVLPRISCPECGFSFVVGEIAVATCPMCSAEVPTGLEDESE